MKFLKKLILNLVFEYNDNTINICLLWLHINVFICYVYLFDCDLKKYCNLRAFCLDDIELLKPSYFTQFYYTIKYTTTH